MKKRYVLYIGIMVILSIFLIKRNREKNIILPDIIIPPPEWNMPAAEETMPKIKDIISAGEKTTALCGDGSVWQWKKGQDREDAVRVEGLENIRKIMYAGPAMYALSEDGHVYLWGCNKWLRFRDVGEEPEYYEEAQEVAGLTDIVDMDTSVDTGNERVRTFAIDKSGNLYVWGVERSVIEKEDFIPEILNGNREAGEGVVSVFAGAGRHHFFVRENETIFSIMDDFRFFWKWEYAYDLIFPVLPIAESETGQEEMIFLMDIPYEDLRKGTKTGFTISYELGSDGTVTCIGADKYTVFMAREDNSLWYWNSKMIPFHDCKEAQVDPESCNQDFSGNWERVTAGDIAGMVQEDGGPLPIADICAGSDNVLFLTENGQVFISEYVTSEVRDVDYYNNMNTNPYRERTLTAWDLEIKELSFRKLDWENIVSINTDGTCHFTAVDENGECFYMDTESED